MADRAAQVVSRPATQTGQDAGICGLSATSPELIDGAGKQRLRNVLQAEGQAFLDHALRHPEPLVRAAAATVAEPADRQALAAAARHTQDPALYALAQQACVGEPAAPFCGDLSLARRAELEPNNAAVWLAMAEEASGQGDEAAAATALRRASSSAQMDQRLHLAAAVLAALPWPDDRAIGRMLVVEAATHAGLATGVPAHAGLMKHCSTAAVADANRQVECGLLAEQLVRPGGNLMDANVALAIARRGSWPADRVDRLQARLLAAQRRAADAELPEAQRWSCRGGEALARRITHASRSGELGALER